MKIYAEREKNDPEGDNGYKGKSEVYMKKESQNYIEDGNGTRCKMNNMKEKKKKQKRIKKRNVITI